MALTSDQKADLAAAIRADPLFLLEHVLGYRMSWYSTIWASWVTRNPRWVILGPRGIGKSYLLVGLIVWWVLRDPDTRIVVVSKTEEQAVKFTSQARQHFEQNALLKEIFGDFVGKARWTDKGFTVAQRTAIYPECTVEARGIEGQLAGTHWNHGAVDDGQDKDRAESELLSQRDWDWLAEVMKPTILPGGDLGLNATPYAWDDMRGRIEIATGLENVFDIEDVRDGALPPPNARWRVLRTPAILRDGSSIDPERLPLEDTTLEDGTILEGLFTKRAENPPAFERQYQQICAKPEQGERETFFRKAWLVPWEAPPARADLEIVLYVDPAWISNEDAAGRTRRQRDPDWFVIVVGAVHRPSRLFYVMDLYRARCSPLERLQKAREFTEAWEPLLVVVERTNLQLKMQGAPEFYRAIRREIGPRVRFDAPQKRKTTRAEPLALACQKGEVRWNPSLLADQDILTEFLVFPNGEEEDEPVHDDCVDATSGAFAWRRRPSALGRFAAQGAVGGGPPEAARFAVPASADPSARGAAPRGGGALGDAARWVVPPR